MNDNEIKTNIEECIKQGIDDLCGTTSENVDFLKNYVVKDASRKIKEDLKNGYRHLNPNLKKAFLSDKGPLNPFLEFVRDHNKECKNEEDKLAVAFRGDEIDVYLMNHKLWEIRCTKKDEYNVSFDFNHARYCKDWKKKYEELKKIGFNQIKGADKNEGNIEKEIIKVGSCEIALYIKKSTKSYFTIEETGKNEEASGKIIGGDVGEIRSTKAKFDRTFVEDSYKILSELIKSYFYRYKDIEVNGNNESENDSRLDYFRVEVWKKIFKWSEEKCREKQKKLKSSNTNNPLIEKRWQQRLFSYFKFTECGDDDSKVFAYDLEFSQRFPSSDVRKILGCNEPDLLAIRFKNGKADKLLLIEVKSTKSACTGDSGIEKHLDGMKKYSKMSFYIRQRIDDAKKIFLQYKESKLYPELTNEMIASIEKLEEKDVEVVLLLTGCNACKADEKESDGGIESAIDFFDEKKDSIKETALQGCKIWSIESKIGPYENDIKIDTQKYNK